MSRFGCVKQAQSNGLVLHFNFRQPFAIFAPHTGEPASVVATLLILSVLCVSNFAKICYAIVRPIAVNMVKLFRRPTSLLVQPSQAMSVVQNVVKPHHNVAIARYAAGWVAWAASPTLKAPSKLTSARIVMNQHFQPVNSQIGRVHVIDNINNDVRCQA